MNLLLTPRKLTTDHFSPFGHVLELDRPSGRPINAGTSQRLDLPGGLDLHQEGGVPVMAVFRARAQALQGPWSQLERHRLGSQTFVPLHGARCVLLVATGAQSPDPATLCAFIVGGDQGFTLKPGTWHHPLIALQDGDFLVLERQGDEVDCEVAPLPQLVELRLV